MRQMTATTLIRLPGPMWPTRRFPGGEREDEGTEREYPCYVETVVRAQP